MYKRIPLVKISYQHPIHILPPPYQQILGTYQQPFSIIVTKIYNISLDFYNYYNYHKVCLYNGQFNP